MAFGPLEAVCWGHAALLVADTTTKAVPPLEDALYHMQFPGTHYSNQEKIEVTLPCPLWLSMIKVIPRILCTFKSCLFPILGAFPGQGSG